MNEEDFRLVLNKTMKVPESEIRYRILEKLNGKKYMIMGNHDKKHIAPYHMMEGVLQGELILDYSSVDNNDVLVLSKPDKLFSAIVKSFDDENYMFSHYALFNDDDWDRKNKMINPRILKLEEYYDSFCCVKNIHGHLHSTKSTFVDSVNVSLEQIDFRPKRLRDLF